MRLFKKINILVFIVLSAFMLSACQTTAKVRQFSELPKIEPGKKRVYVSVQNQQYIVTSKEMGISPAAQAGIAIFALVAAHNTVGLAHFARHPIPDYSRPTSIETDFFTIDGDDIDYISTFTFNSQSLSQYIDLDANKEYDLGAGASQPFIGYSSQIARKSVTFEDEQWVDVLSLGLRHRSFSEDELKKIQNRSIEDSHAQFAEETDELDYYNYGITHIKIKSEDALFCESLRTLSITEDELFEKIELKSKKYLNVKSYLKSSPRFNLACLTIANAISMETSSSKKGAKRVNKKKRKISLGISKVEEENYNSAPIYLKPLK